MNDLQAKRTKGFFTYGDGPVFMPMKKAAKE